MATRMTTQPELARQTVVVIGGSSGIGLETARPARAEGPSKHRSTPSSNRPGATSSGVIPSTEIRWAEKAYPKLIHYNRLPKGGHFAAWEQPQLFSEEMRAAFRSLR